MDPKGTGSRPRRSTRLANSPSYSELVLNYYSSRRDLNSIRARASRRADSARTRSNHTSSINVGARSDPSENVSEALAEGNIEEAVEVEIAFEEEKMAGVVNYIGKLGEYGSAKNDGLPKRYIADVENYVELNKIDDDKQRIRLMRSYLKDDAKLWFYELQEAAEESSDAQEKAKAKEILGSWNYFKEAFIKKFTDVEGDRTFISQFHARKQQEGESVADYAKALKALVSNIKNKSLLGVEAQIIHFQDHLIPRLQYAVAMSGMSISLSWEEAVRQVERMESAINKLYEQQKEVRGNEKRGGKRSGRDGRHTNDSNSESDDEENSWRGRRDDMKEWKKRDLNEIICYACSEKGHYASSCPKANNSSEEGRVKVKEEIKSSSEKEKKSYKKSQAVVHKKDVVEEEEVSSEEERDTIEVPRQVAEVKKKESVKKIKKIKKITTNSSNRFKIITMIGGVKVEGTMDTGAELTCIAVELFNVVSMLQHYEMRKADYELIDANGDTMECIGMVDVEFEPYHGSVINGITSKPVMLTVYLVKTLPAGVLLGPNFWDLVDVIAVSKGEVLLKTGELIRTVEAQEKIAEAMKPTEKALIEEEKPQEKKVEKPVSGPKMYVRPRKKDEKNEVRFINAMNKEKTNKAKKLERTVVTTDGSRPENNVNRDESDDKSEEKEDEQDANYGMTEMQGKVKEGQRRDENKKEIIAYLERQKLPTNVSKAERIRAEDASYVLDEVGLLHYIWQPGNLNTKMDVRKCLVIPKVLRTEVIKQFHEDVIGGNCAVKRTHDVIHDRYYWENMYADVERYCSERVLCARRKTPHRQRCVPMDVDIDQLNYNVNEMTDYVDEIQYRMMRARDTINRHNEEVNQKREKKNSDIKYSKEFKVSDEGMVYFKADEN